MGYSWKHHQFNGLTVSEFADLLVLLLELLADLVRGHAPGQGLGHLAQNAGGSILGAAQVIALTR